MKKRVMIIGPKGCGKTTLARYIDNTDEPITRSQDVIYGKNSIDVPSSYLENPWMYKNIIALTQNAYMVIMLFSSGSRDLIYPPGLAGAFPIKAIGVITMNSPEDDIDYIKLHLKRAGVEDIFEIKRDGKGLKQICKLIEAYRDKEVTNV